MNNIKVPNSKLVIKDNESIHSLYDKMMKGFDSKDYAITSELDGKSNYHVLYAPGNNYMGVGDIVAKCK